MTDGDMARIRAEIAAERWAELIADRDEIYEELEAARRTGGDVAFWEKQAEGIEETITAELDRRVLKMQQEKESRPKKPPRPPEQGRLL